MYWCNGQKNIEKRINHIPMLHMVDAEFGILKKVKTTVGRFDTGYKPPTLTEGYKTLSTLR